MVETTAQKQGNWAKFMHWYESYQGKTVVNCVYSIGASVVIIGALFKIMHFPGAGPVLMAGMITEAILFMIGCLEKPHPEFHWGNVFPQLLEYGTKPELLEWAQSAPKPTLLGMGAEAGVAPAVEGKKAPAVPALTDADMTALKSGIDALAKTASQLSELNKVAASTNQLSDKLQSAGEAADAFAQAGKQISEKSAQLGNSYAEVTANMKKVAAGTEQYGAKIEAIGTQLGSLNAVYELQLNTLQAQVEAFKAQNAQVEKVNAQVEKVSAQVEKVSSIHAEVIKDHEAYEAEAKKLAQQVAKLNAIYGNMLTALA